ncbi:hypothetical protein SNEBB_006217 [Seison nebaliae]|nr:hypothetical protein SNEBB_006217 [Seison nebaliae]
MSFKIFVFSAVVACFAISIETKPANATKKEPAATDEEIVNRIHQYQQLAMERFAQLSNDKQEIVLRDVIGKLYKKEVESLFGKTEDITFEELKNALPADGKEKTEDPVGLIYFDLLAIEVNELYEYMEQILAAKAKKEGEKKE